MEPSCATRYPLVLIHGAGFRDLKWIKQYLPQIEVVKIPNMMHGEFVMMRPEAFAEKALEFLG